MSTNENLRPDEFENSTLGSEEHTSSVEKMESNGWVCIGHESLTTVGFSSDAKFEPVPYQTEQDIKDRHTQNILTSLPGRKFEVALVLDENTSLLSNLRKSVDPNEYQQYLRNLRDKDKSFIVFARELVEK